MMKLNPKFPLYLPGIKNSNNNNISIIGINLREDVARLGLYTTENGSIEKILQKSYTTKDFSSLCDILSQFLEEEKIENVHRLGISVPGPVIDGKSNPPRINWHLDIEDFKSQFGFKIVNMINDQEASAYGIALLEDTDFEAIYEGKNQRTGNAAIIAPGYGLGEAGYFFDGQYLRPFATEGGHSEFSPRTNTEVEFYQFLNNISGVVSWENVLSYNGLFNTYRFLRDVKRHSAPDFLVERFSKGNFAEELYKSATEDNVLISQIVLDTFVEFLARESNSLTLKLKATGGIFIAGDIIQKIFKYIDKDKFYEKFKISDKMENMLKDISIYLIKKDFTSINGVALYTAYCNE